MRSPLSNRSRYVVICVLTSLTVCSSASAELVCHWPLDEDFANLEDPNFDGYLDARAIVDFTEVLPNEDGTGPLQEFAAQFTGAGSFVQTDYPGIGGNQARTVTAWIKTTAIGTNDILGYGVPTNSLKWHFRLNPTAANGVLGAIRTEYQGGQNVGTTAINDGRWHHVAAVFPEGATIGADILHYVDGVLEGRTGNGALVVTTNIDDPAYTLTIGLSRQSATSLRWFNGQIADVRIFDHGLSPQNIFEVMNDEDLTDPVPCDDLSLTCQTVEDENR
ncbi:MAG: LamG domain-containing protein, partial [Planctomycetota bacterium]